MTLILSGDITLRRSWQPMDPDAAAYITAVETADGQALEEKVKIAIDNFVLGCKADGIWNAIKASCILAGARTLNGALVPLTGTAPTNFNFVAGDYGRKTGLLGNASTKYLDSNRNNNADPQDSNHNAFFATAAPVSTHRTMGYGAAGTGANLISGNTGTLNIRNRNGGGATPNLQISSGSLTGHSRASSSLITVRASNTTETISLVSQTPANGNITIFQDLGVYSNARLAFYSIGEALDLAKLDARVTDLINKFAEVIP